jgi:hypothetical protein
MKELKNIFDAITVLIYAILLIISISNKNWGEATAWFCACLLMGRIKFEEYFN